MIYTSNHWRPDEIIASIEEENLYRALSQYCLPATYHYINTHGESPGFRAIRVNTSARPPKVHPTGCIIDRSFRAATVAP